MHGKRHAMNKFLFLGKSCYSVIHWHVLIKITSKLYEVVSQIKTPQITSAHPDKKSYNPQQEVDLVTFDHSKLLTYNPLQYPECSAGSTSSIFDVVYQVSFSLSSEVTLGHVTLFDTEGHRKRK